MVGRKLRRGTRHTFVLGRPVPTSAAPVEAPSDEQVREVLQRWTQEVQRLFREHAASLLPAEVARRGLTISRRTRGDAKGEGGVAVVQADEAEQGHCALRGGDLVSRM